MDERTLFEQYPDFVAQHIATVKDGKAPSEAVLFTGWKKGPCCWEALNTMVFIYLN